MNMARVVKFCLPEATLLCRKFRTSSWKNSVEPTKSSVSPATTAKVNATSHSHILSSSARSPATTRTAKQTPITWVTLGTMLLIGTVMVFYFENEKKRRMEKIFKEVAVTGKPDLGGPFVLVNQKGEPVTDASFKGRYLLLYFGFSHCPDICPSELVKLGKIVDAVRKTNKGTYDLKPLFISVDPNRDSVGILSHYSQDFHENIDYLTGTNEQIAKITRYFRVYFSKVDEDEDGDYLVDHSIVMYLVSPEGEFLDFFTQRMQITDIVNRIMEIVTRKGNTI